MITTNQSNSFDLQKIITDNRLLGLWRLMRGYQLTYFAAILSMGLATAARSAIYFLLGFFVDDILTKSNNISMLPLVALGFVGLSVVEGFSTFYGRKEAARTSEGVTQHLRNYIFDHIQRLSFTYHDQTKTGELIQRSTSDVDAIRRFYADQAINSGRVVLLFVVNMAGLLYLNWRLALLSVVVVPATVVMSYFFFKRVSIAYESFQEQEAVLSNVLQENLTGVRVVKAFARQSFERQKFDRENWEKYQRGKRLLLMHSLFWPISDIVTGAQMLFGYFIAASMAINGEITVGNYLSYTGLLIWIIWPIRNLGRLIVQMSSGLVSYDRVTEIIKQHKEPLEEGDYHPVNIKGEFVFKNVCFEYESDQPVLKGISFTCKPGQAVALLGATGSGKTTLANLLPRFYEYTSGSILLDGKELNRYPRKSLRKQIGIVEQEPFLFSRSIRDNIRYGVGRGVSNEELVAAAKAAAIHDVIVSFPEGYDTLVGEKGVTLSGGQKQRVAIARTLLKNPRILILDDATSSVDTETEAEIRAALEYLMEGRTTFIIAHRIQSVLNADLILVLDHGEIIQHGNHSQLIAKDGIYRQIFDIQTRIELELEKEFAVN